jgi:hypothetical protein
MSADWIDSSNTLPREGQRIEFILDQRSVAMPGTYNRLAFHTRWAQYASERVQSWRNLTLQCDPSRPGQETVALVDSIAASPELSHQLAAG